MSKHRSRILSKIREHKAKNMETSFEGDKSSTINTPIFSPTTHDEEVSLLSYNALTSLWDESASLTVTEGSSTGSAESVAACGLGVVQEMSKDLGEVIASIKQMLPGVSVEVETIQPSKISPDTYHELPPKASKRLRKKMEVPWE